MFTGRKSELKKIEIRKYFDGGGRGISFIYILSIKMMFDVEVS